MEPETGDSSTVICSIRATGVAILQLNRPSKRNALSRQMITDLTGIMRHLDLDTNVRCVVLTSFGQNPFSAGADLVELGQLTTAEAYRIEWLKDLEVAFASFRKPIIAAVRTFAFGGGFEIALMCDMILASANARFGFPEIKLGTIPGLGGTQRLTRTIGKHKAMELILTGAPIAAEELFRLGLLNKVCSAEQDVLEESLKIAETVAAFSAPAVGLAKQAIVAAEATTLGAGLQIERALYYSSFSLADCQEGVAAFLEKRPANFRHQ